MKINHVAMYVNDLENTRQFFIKYFNAKSNDLYHNPKTSFKSYFLSFEDGARLEIMHKDNMLDQDKDLTRTGFIHLSFSVGSKDKVDALTKQLQEDGYTVLSGPRMAGVGSYESSILAFENNQIEITV